MHKFKITTAIFAVAYAHESYIHYRSLKKLEEVMKENAALIALLGYSIKQTDYLSQKLDDNGIPVTEFDKIAMKNL